MAKIDRAAKVQLLADFDAQYAAFVTAGMDEAGRGPLVGNVVAACVVMPKEPLILWVDDSKKLSEKRRESVYAEIMERALYVGIGQATPEEIDRMNILEATKKAMREAASQVPAEVFLIDAVKNLGLNGREIPMVKGDATSYAIAASSIVAKVIIKRLEQFVRLGLAHGFFQRGVPVVVELIQRSHLFNGGHAVVVHNAVDLFLGFSDQLDELFILGGFPQFFQCAGSVDILDKVFILLGNFFQRGDLILIGAIAVQDIVQVLDGAVDQVFFQSVQRSGQLIGHLRQIGAQRFDGLLCFVVSLFDLFRIAACNGILESFQRLFCHGLLYGFLGFFDDLIQSRLEDGVLADLIGQILDLRGKSLDLINSILTDLAV